MTNEEIIRNATESFFQDHLLKQPLPEAVGELIFKVMALKTLQFKEYLEKKENEFLKCTREDFLGRHFDVCGTLISEIINELFKGE